MARRGLTFKVLHEVGPTICAGILDANTTDDGFSHIDESPAIQGCGVQPRPQLSCVNHHHGFNVQSRMACPMSIIMSWCRNLQMTQAFEHFHKITMHRALGCLRVRNSPCPYPYPGPYPGPVQYTGCRTKDHEGICSKSVSNRAAVERLEPTYY